MYFIFSAFRKYIRLYLLQKRTGIWQTLLSIPRYKNDASLKRKENQKYSILPAEHEHECLRRRSKQNFFLNFIGKTP